MALCGCQILAPQPTDQGDGEAGRLINRPAAIATPARAAPPELTAAVKRGDLRDAVVLTGQVVPARTAQLSFRTGGTVRAVYARTGQSVRKDDTLAELVPDDVALKAAQAQATIAELAYQTQQSRINELKRGVGTATLEELRASVTKARAALVEAQLGRTAPAGPPATADIELARLTLDQAHDDLAQAEAAARQSREDPESDASAQAVRTAERKVEEATLKLEQLRATQASARAARERARQQAQRDVEQAQDELARAQLLATGQQAAQPSVEAAAIAVRDAARRYEQLLQARPRSNATASNPNPTNDAGNQEAERQAARRALEEARDRLVNAQVAAQRASDEGRAAYSTEAVAVRTAQRKLDEATARLEVLQGDTRATEEAELRLAQSALDLANEELAQALAAVERAERRRRDAAGAAASASAIAVRAAERKVAEATLKLRQAVESQQNAQAGRESQGPLPELQVAAAQAGLTAAEAKLREAESGGTAAQDLVNEERRLALLLDEVIAARAAAQPTVVLAAPFDGTVTSVDAAAGQAVEAKATVLRLDDPGQLSVVAQASETDVVRLAVGTPVDLTFPGVASAPTPGIISDIGGVATRQADKVSFPVRVEVRAVPAGVKPGMTAAVSAVVREATNVLSVPASAVRTIGGKAVVTRVGADGTVEDVEVAVGGSYGSDVEVLYGVADGDLVATYTPLPPGQAGARR